MADEPILRTPGELLAEARERAGLSLTEVSGRTKIPAAQLQIIERDEYHRLSGPLYVKSFLRNYAEAVGVDVGTILDLYSRSTGEGAPGATSGRPEVWESETVTITRVGVDWGRLLAWGAGGAVVVVGLWLLVRLVFGGGPAETTPTVQPTPPPAKPVVARDTVVTSAPPPTEAATVQEPAPERRETPRDTSRDTLAGGGLRSVPRSVAREAGTPAASTAGGTATGARTDEPVATPAAAAPPPERPQQAATVRDDLPRAFDGAGRIPFAGDSRWPVRVRLVTDAPLVAEAKCDGERRFLQARFAPAAVGQPTQPPRDVETGRAYAVREGLVVYWHAQDHCVLRLDRTAGVEISVNGKVRDTSNLQPGQEIVLDTFR